MAEKSVKKTPAKPAAKKTPVKKPVAKKAAPKKTVKSVSAAPVVETMPCGCDKGCACGGHCHEHCVCHHHKGGFFKKFILFLIIFALGFASAKMCCCKKGCAFGPRPNFENGCLVVKCPKMQQMVPMMDVNHDGCVSKEEFRAHRKQMKHAKPTPANKPAPIAQ